MAAVLALATAEVEAACRDASTGGQVAVAANLNAPDQTVLSGDTGPSPARGGARRGARSRHPAQGEQRSSR
jgi:hypothetical protein